MPDEHNRRLAGPRGLLPGGPLASSSHSGLDDEMTEHALERVLGVPALFSTAYGNVGSSIYYALGLVASFALGLTPLAFIFAGLIFVMTALTYAEGTTRFPEAGGSSSFARHAFNEFVSFATAWAQMLNYIITMSISAFFVPHYLGVFWEPLKSSPGDVVGGLVVILILAVLNIVGVKETAALNISLALADFGTQVALALVGVLLLFSPSVLIENVTFGVAPTWTNLFTGITVAMIAYTGIETISNMAEETRDPVRAVPRAIMWVVVAVLSLYLILPIVALSAMPVYQDKAGTYVTDLGGKYAGDPFIGLVDAFHVPAQWMHTVLEGYVALLAAIILFIATNAGIIGVSRLTYSMGQYQQVPNFMRKIHPRFGTPYISIAIFSVVGVLVILPPVLTGGKVTSTEESQLLGNLYAFGAMLSFSVAHISVFVLRWRGGELPWKAPFNLTMFGRSLPLFAIIGLAGTGSAWIVQVALHPVERIVGVGWMLVGSAIYIAYRRHRGLSLTETLRAPVFIEKPSIEITYNSIIVPVFGAGLDYRAMVTACKVAAERNATIVVLAAVEIPQTLPLNADLGARDQFVNQQLDAARVIGDEYGVEVITRIVRARRAERAILDEITFRESQLVVVGVGLQRISSAPVVSRTIDRIIRRSRTRVLIVRAGQLTPYQWNEHGGNQ